MGPQVSTSVSSLHEQVESFLLFILGQTFVIQQLNDRIALSHSIL